MTDHATEGARAGRGGAAGVATPDPADPGLLAVVAALPNPTALFAADAPHFTLLAASDALVAAAGRPRAALVGRPLAEAFPDPDPPPPEGAGLASLRASLEAAVRTGRPQRMARQRYDLRRPDGTWEPRFWDAVNTPVRDPQAGPDGGADGAPADGAPTDGAPVRAVLHQTEDVTDRVLTEHAAAQAEVRAARDVERMSDAHVTLDPEFRFTAVNAAAERALGTPRHEMLGRTHWEVFPASVDSDAGRAYRRVAAEGVAQHVRQHYVGEGYDRHLEIDAYPTEEGGVAVFWRDVTDRVQDRSALAAFRTLVEHASDAHAIFDPDGRILWANRLMAERLGYAPVTLRAMYVWDIDPHHRAAQYAELFARARAGRVAPFESEHRRRDGSTFPVEVTASVVELAEGWRLFSAVRDISARKAARAELEQAYGQMQDQAAELEAQAEALQATAAHLEEQTEAADAARRAAEAAHARTAGVLEGMADAYFALDADFRITEVNAAMARGSGLPREQLLGRDFWAAFPGAVGTAFEHHYRRAAAERVAAHFTHDYSDGRLDLVVDVDAYPGPDGGVVVFWRDVTARVRAEAAVRESEARYRSLFTSIDEGFCVIELLFDARGAPIDYRFVEANPGFVQQTGLADAVGRTVREVIPGIEQHWIETYGRVATTGDSTRFQMGSDVMGRWFDVFAFRTGRPEARRVALLFTDVSAARAAARDRERLLAASERSRAEADAARAAAEAERRRTAALQGVTAALAEARTLDDIAAVVVGPMAETAGARAGSLAVPVPAGDALRLVRTFGFPEAVLVAARVQPLGLASPIPESFRTGAPIWATRRDGPDGMDARFPAVAHAWAATDLASGAYIPLEVAGQTAGVIAYAFAEPRAFAEPERAFLLALARQVAVAVERARLGEAERAAREGAEAAQDRAEAARREADEANQAKSGFLATMSHELRTPINAMLGYTQLLDMGLAGPLTEQQRRYLERLTASSRHLLGLVNDILDLSKIEAGEATVAHGDGWTGPPVGAALDLVRPQAGAKGVRLIDARPDAQGVPFVGDEDRVRQVVLNLLSNAVKFTPAGGTVTVTCDTVDETPPTAGHLQGEGPWAVVRVADTGIGIAPEEQGRIFDAFHQVDNGHTRTAGGTGLGLAISRRLARLMGGDLTVESAPGAGASFTLWLPAARVAGGAQAETASERSTRAERDVAQLVAPGLGEVGELLRASVDDILAGYADRLRADPQAPRARDLRRIQLEDHAVSFLADLAQSLVIVGDAGPEAAELLKDGSAIQRTIAEAHGARRFAQGFGEAALRRDHQVLREEVERAVRGRLRAGSDDVDAAVRVLLGLIDRAEAISVRAWRRAAAADAPGSPAAGPVGG